MGCNGFDKICLLFLSLPVVLAAFVSVCGFVPPSTTFSVVPETVSATQC